MAVRCLLDVKPCSAVLTVCVHNHQYNAGRIKAIQHNVHLSSYNEGSRCQLCFHLLIHLARSPPIFAHEHISIFLQCPLATTHAYMYGHAHKFTHCLSHNGRNSTLWFRCHFVNYEFVSGGGWMMCMCERERGYD